MKLLRKSLLMACLLAFATHATAQMTEIFVGNNVFAGSPGWEHVRITDNLGQGVTGENFVAQLLYETAPGSLTAHPDVLPFFPAPNVPGYWRGRLLRLYGVGGVNAPVQMQVRVWDAGFGGESPPLTFQEAMLLGRQWGVSEIFTYTQRPQGGVPDLSDTFMYTFRGFQLVPEPGTWALLAFGAGVLFWKCSRRREMKQQPHSGN